MTCLTVSVCPGNVWIHLLFDHSLIVVSFEPDRKSPFGRSSKHCIGPSCPCSVSMHLPSFQTRMLLRGDDVLSVTKSFVCLCHYKQIAALHLEPTCAPLITHAWGPAKLWSTGMMMTHIEQMALTPGTNLDAK